MLDRHHAPWSAAAVPVVPEVFSLGGDGIIVPHINHRRGDTRRRCQTGRPLRLPLGRWNRAANRRLRSAVSSRLQALRSSGYDLVEDALFPVAREADDLWNYD